MNNTIALQPTAKNQLLSKAGILVALALLTRSANLILFKYGALSLQAFTPYNLLTNGYYLASIFSMFLNAVVWQLALRKFDLSFVYPFLSFVFIIILFASYFLFHETITWTNIFGMLFICLGIWFIASIKSESEAGAV